MSWDDGLVTALRAAPGVHPIPGARYAGYHNGEGSCVGGSDHL